MTPQLARARMDLPPPTLHLGSGNTREAMNAAWIVHRTVSRKCGEILPLQPIARRTRSNSALNQAQISNKVFSPQNRLKSNASVQGETLVAGQGRRRHVYCARSRTRSPSNTIQLPRRSTSRLQMAAGLLSRLRESESFAMCRIM